MPKLTSTKPKAGKRTVKKKATATASAPSRNGTQPGRMSERTKQLTIQAFQLAYEQHQRKSA